MERNNENGFIISYLLILFYDIIGMMFKIYFKICVVFFGFWDELL